MKFHLCASQNLLTKLCVYIIPFMVYKFHGFFINFFLSFCYPFSNVVEKCIVHASRHERAALIDEICNSPEGLVTKSVYIHKQ